MKRQHKKPQDSAPHSVILMSFLKTPNDFLCCGTKRAYFEKIFLSVLFDNVKVGWGLTVCLYGESILKCQL